MDSSAVTSPATDLAGESDRAPASPRVGMFPPLGLLQQGTESTQPFLAQASEAGIDHVCYQLPFERFERYCPFGTADDVAEFLAPYTDAGCAEFDLIPQSPDHDQAIAGTAAVKRLVALA